MKAQTSQKTLVIINYSGIAMRFNSFKTRELGNSTWSKSQPRKNQEQEKTLQQKRSIQNPHDEKTSF